MRNFIYLPMVISFLLLFSCSSTDPGKLDIKSVGLRTENKWQIKESEAMPEPVEIFRWQHLYKKSPALSDVKKIEADIKTKVASSSADLIKKARNLATLGRYAEAELAFRECIRKDDRNFSAYLELADLFIKRGMTSLAFEYISEARSILDSSPRIDKVTIYQYRYTLALAYLRSGREKNGVDILKQLIAEEGDFTPAYVALSRAYLTMGNLGLGEFVAKRGLDRGGDEADLSNILGVVEYKKGDLQAARRWYNKCLSLNPDHVPALVNRASLGVMKGELERAENDLNRSLILNSGHVEAMIVLSTIYARTGRFEKARNLLSRALDIDPENAFARYNLGVLHVAHFDDYTTALRFFNEVVQLTREDSVLGDAAASHIASLKGDNI